MNSDIESSEGMEDPAEFLSRVHEGLQNLAKRRKLHMDTKSKQQQTMIGSTMRVRFTRALRRAYHRMIVSENLPPGCIIENCSVDAKSVPATKHRLRHKGPYMTRVLTFSSVSDL